MKEITRKQFMGGMAVTVALGWRGASAAPARRQRNYDDMTWWDPYVENSAGTDHIKAFIIKGFGIVWG